MNKIAPTFLVFLKSTWILKKFSEVARLLPQKNVPLPNTN